MHKYHMHAYHKATPMTHMTATTTTGGKITCDLPKVLTEDGVDAEAARAREKHSPGLRGTQTEGAERMLRLL